MRSFIYIVTTSSPLRGYNRSIRVYEIIKNWPMKIGDDEKISTASYKGDRAIACKIISNNTDLQLDPAGYGLVDKDVIIVDV